MRLARLAINGWPPLASHFLAFFLGTVVVHHLNGAGGADQEFAPLAFGELMARAPVWLERSLRDRKGGLRQGFYISQNSSGNSICRLHRKPLRYWYNKQDNKIYLLVAAADDFSFIRSVEKNSDKSQDDTKSAIYSITGKKYGSKLAVCQRLAHPKVYYGN